MIEFRNVSYGYGDGPLLSNISFHLADGSFTAVAGENGAGKSTLCRLAAALLRQMIASSHTLGLASIALTCKAEKIGYYARFGFAARGISASVHGGAVWYDMTLENP